MIVTLDWETLYSDDYTLKKMTTEAYVRDARFKPHGLAIKFDDAPATWFPPSVLHVPRMRARIEQSAVLCHHAQFDGLILWHHYGLCPAMWLDTLSMARIAVPHERHSLDNLCKVFGLPGKQYQKLLDVKGVADLAPWQYEQLGVMSCDDADKTYKIFQQIKDQIPRDEFRIIDMTIRMFTEPSLVLDRPLMENYAERVKGNKDGILDFLQVTREQLNSANKFAGILRALGIEPPTKQGKSETIYAFAKTDAGMRELLEHDDERVSAVSSARLGIKSSIAETRCERLLSMDARGRCAVYLRYAGAHTTRWSGGDALNWQNFPRGGDIRKSILAPPGKKIVVADSSQIECRMVNWLAGQLDVVETFRQNKDPYVGVASQFYGRTITRADKTERHLGKTIELGCGYGMGAERFKVTCANGPLGGAPIHLTLDEAQAAVDIYRGTHKRVVWMWYHTAEDALNALANGGTLEWGPMAIDQGAVWLPNGLPLCYDDPQVDNNGDRWFKVRGRRSKMYGGKLVENVVQALSRVVLSEAMLRISQRYKIVNCTHDEVMVLADVDDAEALPYLLSELRKEPTWAPGLPLDAEGVEGERYGK